MTKGTPSFGKRNKRRLHLMCRRCGKSGLNRKTKICVKCGFGRSSHLKNREWGRK
ncbi:MAG: 50S ribosomal protein L37e [Candidatus Altiarchaeota archaeon]|nr:50S ribosomal protein L37e [Candidatus Altiarchaeota archaeon]